MNLWKVRQLLYLVLVTLQIYAIQKAQQMGAKVVTCSDSTGWIYDPEGIDVALLKEVKRSKNVLVLLSTCCCKKECRIS